MTTSRWIVGGLAALNVLLGIAVYQHLHMDTTAYAQVGGRKEVVTVSGLSAGVPVLYMFDTRGGMMVVLKPDGVNKKVDVVCKRDVGGDFARMK